MKNAFATASITLGLLLVGVGCNPKPVAIYKIQQSELPPAAKALLSSEAEIVDVHQAVYDKGGKDYIIDYKIDGNTKQVKYADYHQTQPTYVFEKFNSVETR
ncbi:MAG: hypothetical protein EOP08_07950 [Proteobacteria bacterium]|nr:MAG: hypothetical protein EOP08_07950 [Pseudomonadota bacterium]